MKQRSQFVISKFANPSGHFAFRVSGWLMGERVRRNFSTRAEAQAEVRFLDLKSLQGTGGVRTAITRLTDEELGMAETAMGWLKDKPRSLLFYLEFAFANFRAADHEQNLEPAIAEYLASKQRQVDQAVITSCQVMCIKKELKILQTRFQNPVLSELTPRRLSEFCERGQPSLKTVNNRRGILSTFFRFAFQKEWIATNPVERVVRHRLTRRRSTVQTLTAADSEALMRFAQSYHDGALVPFFALCLFAGIRPCVRNGEILKLRPDHIHLDEGIIVIPPEVSKVHEKRVIAIQPNLGAWLRAYPSNRYPLVPPNLQHTRAKAAKQFGLTKDILRHTFISMFVARFRSLGEAALQAGNSEAVIRKHYLDLKTKAEADDFWNIRPQPLVAAETSSAEIWTSVPMIKCSSQIKAESAA